MQNLGPQAQTPFWENLEKKFKCWVGPNHNLFCRKFVVFAMSIRKFQRDDGITNFLIPDTGIEKLINSGIAIIIQASGFSWSTWKQRGRFSSSAARRSFSTWHGRTSTTAVICQGPRRSTSEQRDSARLILKNLKHTSWRGQKCCTAFGSFDHTFPAQQRNKISVDVCIGRRRTQRTE